MDGFGGQLAVLHGLDGEVLAQRSAVATGIHPGRLVRSCSSTRMRSPSRANCAASGSPRLASSKRWPMALKMASAASSKVSPVSRRWPSASSVRAKRIPRTLPLSSSNTASGRAQVCRRTWLALAMSCSWPVAPMSAWPRRYTRLTSRAPRRLICTAMSIAVLPAPITRQRSASGSWLRSSAWRSSRMYSVAATTPGACSSGRPSWLTAFRPRPRNTASYCSRNSPRLRLPPRRWPWRISIPPMPSRNSTSRWA